MVAILLIALGKYEVFLQPLIKSINDKFITNREKKIVIFTDSEKEFGDNTIKIHTIKRGWPRDTMMRFDLFYEYKHLFEECENIIYMDSDMLVNEIIEDDILEHELFGVIHPGFYKNRGIGSFQIDKKSAAAVDFDKIKDLYYYQGCFFGAKRNNFNKLVESCKTTQDIDYSNSVNAIWDDESHLNRYFSEHIPYGVDPGYAFPEHWKIPFKKRIIHLAKDHSDMRA